MLLRRAAIGDVPAIGKIINDAAEFGQMLHRSRAYLYEHIRDFQVAEIDGQAVGVCGLNIVWANLAEVYALAVAPAYRGQGIGGRLVLAVMEEARQLGLAKLMTLTYEKSFFERLGFTIVDRQELPLKVWSQCVYCLKNQACDEIAMIRQIEGVPDLAQEARVGEATESAEHEYEVPVQVNVIPRQSAGPRPLMDEAPRE